MLENLRWKSNSNEFITSLWRRGRRWVYHWTPLANLRSVLTHGILCRRELERRGIRYRGHSYGALGKDRDFADYVCVSFYPQKGMMGRGTESPVIIELPSWVTAIEGSFYCPGNSASSKYTFVEVATWTTLKHLDALFSRPDEPELNDWQAEVWIPNGIPTSAFQRVLFQNADDLARSKRQCSDLAFVRSGDLRFTVGEAWMFPGPAMAAGPHALDGPLSELEK
jgi:hypothetical protein